jgi:hypothetical protein
MSSFALSYTANIFILTILYDFCLLPAQFCYLIVYIRNVENLWRRNLFEIRYKNFVRTSHETHYISATKSNLLILFEETVAVYCKNHTEYADTLCEQISDF